MKPERFIATILFTDIVGSTERAAELGDRRWQELRGRHHAIVREELVRWGGREVSEAGDGFLSLFDNHAQAILSATALRDRLLELGLNVRCGVHMGEVERSADGSLGGITLHIGARVTAEAGGGDVLVSSAVRDVEAGSGFGFEDRGHHELKGVPGQWPLFAVTGVPGDVAPPQRLPWIRQVSQRMSTGAIAFAVILGLAGLYLVFRDRDRTFTPPPAIAETAPGIAVLPFTVRGEGLEIWREGMVDLLSTGMDGAAGLRAISSLTVMARWQERVSGVQTVDLPRALEAASATGARYALVGSAVAIGHDLRLVVDAYDIDTGDRLGQAQVDGPPDDVLALCDRLGVEALAIILQKGEEELPQIDLASLMSDSTTAVKAYLEGEVHYRQLDHAAAEKDYRRAIEADTTFALAHYRLSIVYRFQEISNQTLAAHHLRRAVQLADRLPLRAALLVRATALWLRQAPEALELLRQAVQLYPDDAEAWYMLGEVLYHFPAAFPEEGEMERAFERAVELDPRDAHFFYHYIELAWIFHGDSALVAERLGMFERVSPGHWLTSAGRLAIDLAFGDSIAQSEAMIQLRSEEDTRVVNAVSFPLMHPRYAALQPVLRLLHERGDDNQRSQAGAQLFYISASWYGHLREALPYLDDPSITVGWRAYAVYRAFVVGLPMPEETLEQALDPALIDSMASRLTLFYVGAFAADRGRWPDHAHAIAELQRREELARAEADSIVAEQFLGAVRALEGYALWRQGQPTEALAMLEDPFALNYPWRVVRLWLGQLYEELDRLGDVESVHRSFEVGFGALSGHPLSQRQLGKNYEQLGEYDKAVESYEYFVHYWQDADPELQPMVEEARQAIIRLERVQRE
jgi:class 3 adenylate cyclase/tetratricopeptide (TPR) repeat protein